jgi:hypothetical protein
MRPLTLLDSISAVGPGEAGHVVATGSHGGLAAVRFVLAQPHPPHAVIFNDAGVGKEGAGIVGLRLLQEAGVIAAACAHHSARIGEAAETLESGVLSHLNPLARAAGLREGMAVTQAVRVLGVAGAPSPGPAPDVALPRKEQP